jgi:hypothetical protein
VSLRDGPSGHGRRISRNIHADSAWHEWTESGCNRHSHSPDVLAFAHRQVFSQQHHRIVHNGAWELLWRVHNARHAPARLDALIDSEAQWRALGYKLRDDLGWALAYDYLQQTVNAPVPKVA